jgi:serine acetyltransferase
LVAPISVADNAFIAAGSTVTDDIPEGAFAIARNRQINKIDYAKNLIKAKKLKKTKRIDNNQSKLYNEIAIKSFRKLEYPSHLNVFAR